MSPEELQAALLGEGEVALTERFLADVNVPYVFDGRQDAWDSFRNDLSNALQVEAGDIRIIGSGLFGFSLAPGNNFRSFRDQSDVDVAIVNTARFDYIWKELLSAAYPRPPVHCGGLMRERQKSVYTGWISPDQIGFDRNVIGPNTTRALNFKSTWFLSLKRAARHVTRRHEDVNARLYRTWGHIHMYQHHSFNALRRELMRQGG